MNLLSVALVLAMPGLASAAGSDETPMTVYLQAAQVEERKEVDKATEKALKEERKKAEEARKALEKELKSQYGKKKEEWPEEAQERYYLAEEAQAIAHANYEYRKTDPSGIEDSLEDLTQSVRGEGIAGLKERVVLVDSPEQAQLIVEVRARRSTKNFGAVVPSNCYTLFSIGAGPGVDSARFAELPRDYRPRKTFVYVWRISAPKPDDPTYVFESYNGGNTPFGCHGAAANAAATAIDKFIEDNRAFLLSPSEE